ncbi:MAG: ArsA-related P-loop ATPase [Pseudomonadota bacterium]
MKLAVTGKGGVGKTTVSAILVYLLAQKGTKVLAIDADPSPHLADALAFPEAEKITPLAEMKDLLMERSGSAGGPFFNLNPRVDDLPDRFTIKRGNIHLMVLGSVQKGGGGCACPENIVLRTLVRKLFLSDSEAVVLDMEAGVEHLGRGTVQAVDALIVVVEPSRGSIETASKIIRLAQEIGLKRILIVGNKMQNEADKEYLRKNIKDLPVVGFMPLDPKVLDGERQGIPPFEASPALRQAGENLLKKVLSTEG